MATKRATRFLFFMALLTIVGVLIWRTQDNAVNADDNPGPGVIETETPTATATSTATVTNTPDPQSSQTPAATPTETATPTSTATVASPEFDNFSYMPALVAIPPPSPPGCIPQPHIPAYSISAEQQLADILNAYRLNNGKIELNVMPHLSQAARRHVLDMAANDFLDHIGSDDSSVGSRAHDACYEWLHIGQILGSDDTVESMVNSWIKTQDNRDLILSDEYLDFGLAYLYDPDSLYKHYWVVVFGRHVSAGQYIE